MITKTEQLKPCLETDQEEYKELISMYNDWYAETAFKSNINWVNTNENWKKMHDYCQEHPDILKKFWLDIYNTFGEVGHFTFMLHYVFPNTIECVGGYCPLSDIEKAWAMSLIGLNNK